MKLLLDTNIFLEVILEQQAADEAVRRWRTPVATTCSSRTTPCTRSGCCVPPWAARGVHGIRERPDRGASDARAQGASRALLQEWPLVQH